MKAFIVLALAAAANCAVVLPYAGLNHGLAYPGLNHGLAYSGLPLAGAPLAYAAGAPLALGYASAIAPIPAPAPSTQFRAQDEFGNVNYGYANINSAKQESGNAYHGVTGSYQYVDAEGKLQTTSYIADALGFRVQATNLPVAPVANLVQPENTLVGPAPVTDTAEVAAAKAEFQKAFDEAASREKRDADEAEAEAEEAKPATILPYGIPFAGYGYGLNSYGYGLPATTFGYGLPAASYGYGLPAVAPAVVASAPAVREATLTKIKLTPGHAIAYKVE